MEIKQKIRAVVINAANKIQLWIIKRLINKSNVFKFTAVAHAQIIASSIFENNTTNENLNIVVSALYKLLNIEALSLEGEVNSEQVEELILNLKNNKDVLNLLAEYNLAKAYAFTKIFLTDTNQFIDEYIANAKLFNADIEPFNHQSFNKRLKEVKTERKNLQKKLKQTLNNTIAKKKEDKIGQISLKSSDIVILFSLFSSLFLISGYYYNHSLLKEFNVNSDHFYLISDYISTSVSLIITPLLWTGIFIISFLIGVNDSLGNRIKEKQLNIKIDDKPPIALPLFIILINIMNLFSIWEGRFESNNTVLAINALVVSLYFIVKIPFHYFKNPIKVFICILVFMGFIWNLNAKVNREIQKITSDGYQSKYIVTFNEKMIKNESLEFITLNSNYLIMRNTDSKSIEIYPKSYIKKLTPNPNQSHELNFIEWVVAFIEINGKLYEIITKEIEKKISE
jgi:hypothetical protein